MFENEEDWTISSQAPYKLPFNGEGSTTIPEGSRSKIIDRKTKQPRSVGIRWKPKIKNWLKI